MGQITFFSFFLERVWRAAIQTKFALPQIGICTTWNDFRDTEKKNNGTFFSQTFKVDENKVP